jgi:ABC-type transport system involved in cytochrome c biogenesis permease subunit
MYTMFPLMTIAFIVYAALTVLNITGAANGVTVPWHQAEIVSLPLYSKDEWKVTGGDIFLFASMGLLFVELIRSTKTGQASITNHLLSFMLFILVLLAFILAPKFGNSTFFLFMLMTLLDPMAGFVVTTVTARRDFVTDDKKVVIGGGH